MEVLQLLMLARENRILLQCIDEEPAMIYLRCSKAEFRSLCERTHFQSTFLFLFEEFSRNNQILVNGLEYSTVKRSFTTNSQLVFKRLFYNECTQKLFFLIRSRLITKHEGGLLGRNQSLYDFIRYLAQQSVHLLDEASRRYYKVETSKEIFMF